MRWRWRTIGHDELPAGPADQPRLGRQAMTRPEFVDHAEPGLLDELVEPGRRGGLACTAVENEDSLSATAISRSGRRRRRGLARTISVDEVAANPDRAEGQDLVGIAAGDLRRALRRSAGSADRPRRRSRSAGFGGTSRMFDGGCID
jgi:hypothetical protein